MAKRSMGHRRAPSPFAKILTRLMDEKGLKVREAARIAEVGPSTIVSWRSGALPEDYSAVKRLAARLGVTLSFILTGEDDSRPMGSSAPVTEVFEDGGMLFDGYAKITIQRLLPRNKKSAL